MSRFFKKRSKKAGLPPGSIVHIGDKITEKIGISLIKYGDNFCEEKKIENIEESFKEKDDISILWINIEGIHDTSIIEKTGTFFNLHPLLQEDIANSQQRPKIDEYADSFSLFLKMLTYNDDNNQLQSEQITLIFGKNFLITFQEGLKGDVFETVRARLRSGKGKIRKRGTDYLAYALVDAIIDNYFEILEKFGDEIEILEDELMQNPSPYTMQEIHILKREILLLRKSAWPLREVINHLQKEENPLINELTKIYLRDVYDHTIQIIDTVETFRDILSEMFDIYLSSVSNKLNETMKFLTALSTIFIPVTFLVGVYGMNFKFMPELEMKWTYPALWVIMITASIVTYLYFRKKNFI
ncbi:MAG: magnesium/cobalt transporter CorA [Candidatus Coatesbacteria bacterium]|nr:magnesium/cobalt transporter CorA [Candidatus Coatesbacteria bacterium]